MGIIRASVERLFPSSKGKEQTPAPTEDKMPDVPRSGVILTGVDKLVALIRERQKISVDDAAAELGVSKRLIEEWADFLEEEGVVEMKYSFANTYLTDSKLSEYEAAQKEKRFGRQRETYLGSASSVPVPTASSAEFEDFRKELRLFRHEFSDRLDTFHDEIKSLRSQEHNRAMALLQKERHALELKEREMKHATLEVSDVYWLAHNFLNAILAAEGKHTEDEFSHAVNTFKHDFVSIAPDLAQRWQSFFEELSKAKHGVTNPNPEEVHMLFLHARSLIDDTVHAAIEPVDNFPKRMQALQALVQSGDIRKAEEEYYVMLSEYEKLSDERKHVHYDKLNQIYHSIVGARINK